jgi:hypothetical protein
MNKMIPLLLQNKSFLKNNFIPFMSLTLNAQIEKMEPPFGMQVCKIQNCKYYFTERYCTNKVSVSNGIKLRTLQNRK